MTQEGRQWRFWLVAGVAAIVLLWLLRGMLLPFVMGAAIAFFLDPAADWLEQRKVSRAWATTIITATFFLIVGLLTLLIVPRVIEQARDFLQELPRLYRSLREFAEPYLQRVIDQANTGDNSQSVSMLGGVLEKLASVTGDLLGVVLGGGLVIVDLVSVLVITPVVTFYLLRDWDRIIAKVDSWLPLRYADSIREQASEVQKVLAGFVRGQASVCVILAVFYGVALSVVGLKFGLIIALITGILTFIPFVGTLFGFVASLSVAIFQFWPDYWMVLIVAGIYGFGQFVEGNFLSPILLGDKVNLHPVWMMFSLMAGGALFGFVGVLIAVPAFAVIGVLVRFGLRRYLASPLYGGPPPAEP
jgi:predicted PurR-regulated permease PerM